MLNCRAAVYICFVGFQDASSWCTCTLSVLFECISGGMTWVTGKFTMSSLLVFCNVTVACFSASFYVFTDSLFAIKRVVFQFSFWLCSFARLPWLSSPRSLFYGADSYCVTLHIHPLCYYDITYSSPSHQRLVTMLCWQWDNPPHGLKYK